MAYYLSINYSTVFYILTCTIVFPVYYQKVIFISKISS